MKASELKDRTKKFSVRVIKLVEKLPKTTAGEAMASPLIRCGTAVGATYRLTCKSKNNFDFMSRLGTTEEATDECCYWLEIIHEAEVLPEGEVLPALEEARILKRIFKKSRRAAVKRHRNDMGGSGRVSDEDIPF
ncbi:MAG: four helix bundle protein [Phycisphaeraceae bacterium]